MAAPICGRIPCSLYQLKLDRALACGQSFRWKEVTPGEWTGVIGQEVWRLRQTESHLQYQVFSNRGQSSSSNQHTQAEKTCKGKVHKKGLKKKPQNGDVVIDKCINSENKDRDAGTDSCNQDCRRCEDVLRKYFQLDVNLEELYRQWSEADEKFHQVSQTFTGIRIIRQDPVECLFSFICSSNNNISRITSMVDKLAVNYGSKVLCLDGQDFFTFPTVSALAMDGVEDKLRSLGFGYRAKYIQTSARYIQAQGGDQWLHSLRGQRYDYTKSQLMKLCGVGAKVADCVALFSLDQTGSIPVDTHVWQICARDYLPKLRQAKSLTDALYKEIGDTFRNLWGPYAGWAHSVLFTADLKQFKEKKINSEQQSTIKRKPITSPMQQTKKCKKQA